MNETTQDDAIMLPEGDSSVIGVLGFSAVTFGTATCIFCILGNITVLLDIRHNVTGMSSLTHRTNTLFHLSQTIIDLILGSFIMPIHLLVDSHLAGDWLFNTSACRIWYAFDVALCTGAIWNQYISCLDKYWCVTSPVTYSGKKRRSRIKQMFRILLLLACGIGSPVLFDCSLADNPLYAFYSTLGSFWIPMITLIVLSIRCFRYRRSLLKFNNTLIGSSPTFKIVKTFLVKHLPIHRFRGFFERHFGIAWQSTNPGPSPAGNERPVNRSCTNYTLVDFAANDLHYNSGNKYYLSLPNTMPQPSILSQSLGLPQSQSLPAFYQHHYSQIGTVGGNLVRTGLRRKKQPSGIRARDCVSTDNVNISVIRHISNRAKDTPWDDFNGPCPCMSTTHRHRCPSNPIPKKSADEGNTEPSTTTGGWQQEKQTVKFNIAPALEKRISRVTKGRCTRSTLIPIRRVLKTSASTSELRNRESEIKAIKGLRKSATTCALLSENSAEKKSAQINDPHKEKQTDREIEELLSFSTGDNSDDLSLEFQLNNVQKKFSRSSRMFRRLGIFVNRALGRSNDQLPVDTYWRLCNINEHFIYSTTIVLSCCWGPFFVMYALGLIFHVESSVKVIRFLLWLGYFNSALNPALYYILTGYYES